MNRVLRSCLAPAAFLLAGATSVLAADAPSRVEGIPDYVDRPLLTASVPIVQPSRVEPYAVCGGGEVTLYPAPGAVFSPRDSASRVLFAPCGIPGDIVDWTPAAIRVKVPEEAESGQVWLAGGVDDAFSAELDRGRACRRSLIEQEVVLERLGTECDPALGDRYSLRAATMLRGIPPSKEFPQGVPPVRAGEREPGDPPACRIVGPDRRGPLTFKGQKGTSIRMGEGQASGCFETCEEVVGGQVMITVLHPPRVERFLPDTSELVSRHTHRVERGAYHVAWQVWSALPPTLTLSRDGAAGTPVAMDSSDTFDVFEPIDLTLQGSNACGTRSVSLYLVPVTRLHIGPERMELNPGDRGEVVITIEAPLGADLPIAIDDTSGGALQLDATRVVLPAGATEIRVGVRLSTLATSLGAGGVAGLLTVRAADPDNPDCPPAADAGDLTRVVVGPRGVAAPPGPGQTVVQGMLSYRECMPPDAGPADPAFTLDALRCVVDPSGVGVVKPVRHARVEVWDQRPFPNVQLLVVETDDNGNFRALVPSGGTIDVTVVASSPAGQVNRDNDAFTWFWKPLALPQAATSRGTVTFNFTFNQSDSRFFNALDAITRGREYAIDRSGVPAGSADATFHQVSVIPSFGTIGAVTLAVGLQSHIWTNNAFDIFRDKTLLHEYGHHLQHSNGSYQAWGTFHNGCYATAVAGPACLGRQVPAGGVDTARDLGCWVNSNQLAWFEGFADYFSRSVMAFDAALPAPAFTLNTGDLFTFSPTPGSTCPLLSAAHSNHLNEPITGAAIEDHVDGALTGLLGATVTGPGGALTRRQLEDTVFQVFFSDMMGSAGSIGRFRTRWMARFPGDTAWDAIMAAFGMPLGSM